MSEDSRVMKSIVKKEESNRRIDHFLSERFTYLTRNQWQKKIKIGDILLNGKKCRSSRILNERDCVEFIETQSRKEPEVSCVFKILFEDEDLLIVDKPANLPTHPAGLYFNNTLWAFLRPRYGDVHIITRLDRETSGIVLIARNSTTAAALQMAEIKKYYYVLVEGEFPNYIHAKGFLFNDTHSIVRKKRHFSYEQPSEEIPSEFSNTHLHGIKYKNGISWIEARLETGRLHQIRATLKSLGYPVVGDKIYGVNELFYIHFIEQRLSELDEQILRINRQALHAHKISFIHPYSKKLMELEAPIPEEFLNFI